MSTLMHEFRDVSINIYHHIAIHVYLKLTFVDIYICSSAEQTKPHKSVPCK